MIHVSIFRAKIVRSARISGANGRFVAESVRIVRIVAEFNQWLCLKGLISITFNAHTVISALGGAKIQSLLHRRLARLRVYRVKIKFETS